jgi:hypothetical protein
LTSIHFCEAYLGILPHFLLWRHLSCVKSTGKRSGPVGAVMFCLRSGLKSEWWTRWLTMRGRPPLHQLRLKGGQLRRQRRTRGWVVPCALVTRELEVLWGMSECRLLRVSLMWTPSAQGLLGMTTTWSRTRLRLARRQEVRGRPVYRYLTHLRQARGCRDEKLTRMTLLGRMISSMTTRICRPCRPAL